MATHLYIPQSLVQGYKFASLPRRSLIPIHQFFARLHTLISSPANDYCRTEIDHDNDRTHHLLHHPKESENENEMVDKESFSITYKHFYFD